MTPSPRNMRERKEDTDKKAAVNHFIERYKFLWPPMWIVFGALGFGIITPKKTAQELQAQITTNQTTVTTRIERLETQADALKQTHRDLEEDIHIVIRSLCLLLAPRDRLAVGLTEPKCNR